MNLVHMLLHAPLPKALPSATEPPPTVTIRLAVPRALVLASINAAVDASMLFFIKFFIVDLT